MVSKEQIPKPATLQGAPTLLPSTGSAVPASGVSCTEAAPGAQGGHQQVLPLAGKPQGSLCMLGIQLTALALLHYSVFSTLLKAAAKATPLGIHKTELLILKNKLLFLLLFHSLHIK